MPRSSTSGIAIVVGLVGQHARRATVKWNVLPAPGVLSTQMRPPISSTRFDEIVKPETGAAVPARNRSVGLAERLENERLLVARECRCRCR